MNTSATVVRPTIEDHRELKDRGKGYVNECHRQHLADPTEGPKFLRNPLRLDAS
ncbi:hypothetical protein RCO28_39220 [Streptomyces sp. LHD-70]|uniref:hypothetical protein n=1 Tax=Streptomyces sp. LHD-70 TaxID=3072140 RepID=UPI00280F51AA|nr:hypothetical protein [Streptomyces sp. LHD-70]MDQ8708443.1 hypothetical protein [Streptomyces sp. LHD-70]